LRRLRPDEIDDRVQIEPTRRSLLSIAAAVSAACAVIPPRCLAGSGVALACADEFAVTGLDESDSSTVDTVVGAGGAASRSGRSSLPPQPPTSTTTRHTPTSTSCDPDDTFADVGCVRAKRSRVV
jgi:hypothetical protein